VQAGVGVNVLNAGWFYWEQHPKIVYVTKDAM
jgi:hypothetical protein